MVIQLILLGLLVFLWIGYFWLMSGRPTELEFKFTGDKMANILIGETITATPSETNAAGAVPLVVGNIQWNIADASIAEITGIDPTTGVATFKGLAAGTVNITATDAVFKLSHVEVLTVTDPKNVPTELTFVWGTPTPAV